MISDDPHKQNLARCIDMDRQLQEYLNRYFEQPKEIEVEVDVKNILDNQSDVENMSEDDLPF